MRILALPLIAITAGLAGCYSMEHASTFMTFKSDPLVLATQKPDATKKSMLAFRQPDKRTPTRNNTSECFDYQLHNGAQRAVYYVGFTSSGEVNDGGYMTCAEALRLGRLRSDAPLKQIY